MAAYLNLRLGQYLQRSTSHCANTYIVANPRVQAWIHSQDQGRWLSRGFDFYILNPDLVVELLLRWG